METSLAGLILLILSLAFASFGYFLYLNLKDEAMAAVDTFAKKGAAVEVAEEGELPAEARDVAARVPEPLSGLSGQEESERAKNGGAPRPSQEAETSEFVPVARLLRDYPSGDLILQIGDRIYRTRAELRSSPDWSVVQQLSIDLAVWLAGPTAGQAAASREAQQKQTNMLAEINEILKTKLDALPEKLRGVELMSDAAGNVRVLVAGRSYPIEEVPFEEVQELIRQAAAEWEARQ
jgi:hypothetical protein